MQSTRKNFSIQKAIQVSEPIQKGLDIIEKIDDPDTLLQWLACMKRLAHARIVYLANPKYKQK